MEIKSYTVFRSYVIDINGNECLKVELIDMKNKKYYLLVRKNEDGYFIEDITAHGVTEYYETLNSVIEYIKSENFTRKDIGL